VSLDTSIVDYGGEAICSDTIGAAVFGQPVQRRLHRRRYVCAAVSITRSVHDWIKHNMLY
jgi:hypothetical protein